MSQTISWTNFTPPGLTLEPSASDSVLTMDIESWGRFPKTRSEGIWFPDRDAPLPIRETSLLPYGLGRSYGDSCLNDGNAVILTHRLDRFITFDETTGILRCEAGVSLESILNTFVPRGFFLPVTPGTKFVTVGGSIANDIHGKNHHAAGTFGGHVVRFGLLRSDGRFICSPTENVEFFRATIGGLGLTGLITWAEIKLIPIKSPFLDTSTIKFRNLDEFFEVSAANEEKYVYSVSWVDCTSRGDALGRGLYMGGNFSDREKHQLPALPRNLKVTFPFDAPAWLLNPVSISSFNTLYFNKQRGTVVSGVSHYNPFFYPLDAILKWNRMYGRRGFFQYQLVVPFKSDLSAIKTIFDLITRSGQASFLAVLKTFGDVASPGILSFPKPGVTLALDFANDGERTLGLMEDLDAIVRSSGGRVYPAKDARMSAESFRTYFPEADQLERFIDPAFSSSFWRRVHS